MPTRAHGLPFASHTARTVATERRVSADQAMASMRVLLCAALAGSGAAQNMGQWVGGEHCAGSHCGPGKAGPMGQCEHPAGAGRVLALPHGSRLAGPAVGARAVLAADPLPHVLRGPGPGQGSAEEHAHACHCLICAHASLCSNRAGSVRRERQPVGARRQAFRGSAGGVFGSSTRRAGRTTPRRRAVSRRSREAPRSLCMREFIFNFLLVRCVGEGRSGGI